MSGIRFDRLEYRNSRLATPDQLGSRPRRPKAQSENTLVFNINPTSSPGPNALALRYSRQVPSPETNPARYSRSTFLDPNSARQSKIDLVQTPSTNIDLATLKIVEDWNRNGKIPKALLEEDSSHGALNMESISIYKIVYSRRLYHLQNQIMDLFWRSSRARPKRYTGLSTVAILDEAGLGHTMLYTFALRGSVRAFMEGRVKDNQWEVDLQELDDNPGAMKDVLIYIRRWIKEGPWKKPGKDDACDYHIHIDGSRCSSGYISGATSDDNQGSENGTAETGPSNPTTATDDTS